MIPSTPCTSPELVSTSAIHLQLLSLFFFPKSVASLCACRLFTLDLIFWICTRAALGGGKSAACWRPAGFCFKEQPTNQQPTSVPTRAAFQTSNPVLWNQRGVSSTQKKTKIQVEPLFSLCSIWMSALLCLWYTERGSGATHAECVSAALWLSQLSRTLIYFYLKAHVGKFCHNVSGLLGGGKGTLPEQRWRGIHLLRMRAIYIYIHIFFSF